MRSVKKRAFGNLYQTRSGGLTIVELMLAMAITGLIGAAITAMVVSVAYGTTSRSDMCSLAVRQQTISGRINASVRSSKMILAEGTNYMVLWMGDTRENDFPNLSEIRRIELNAGTDELRSFRAPSNLAEADDTEYVLTDDFNAITNTLKGGVKFPGEVWAKDVTVWTRTMNNVDPQSATLVSYTVTLQGTDLTYTGGGTISLR